ncbi:MAG: hypothetical protein ACLGQX_12435 [Acidobacteriota bacterium]
MPRFVLAAGRKNWRAMESSSEMIEVDPAGGELPAGHDHRHTFGKAAGY